MGKERKLRLARRSERRTAYLQSLIRPTVTQDHAAALEACTRGDAAVALQLLEGVPPTAPSYWIARANIADLLLRLGRWAEAEQVARDVVRAGRGFNSLQPPQLVGAARHLAEIVSVQGREAEAGPLFDYASRLASRCANEARGESTQLADLYEIEEASILTSWGANATHLCEFDIACDMLRTAREIHDRNQYSKPRDRADTLSKFGKALYLSGREFEAELALREALEVMGSTDEHMAVEILGVLGRIGSPHFDLAKDLPRIRRDAELAKRQGRFSAAHTRLCIYAEIAARNGDLAAGRDALAEAIAVEDELDTADLNPAKLRYVHAQLLRGANADTREITSTLLDGARLWFERLTRPFVQRDFAAMAGEMHDNFRLLSRSLLDADRTAESLLAFEAGRAIAHCTIVDSSFRERIIGRNPFRRGATDVEIDAITEVQRSLAADEVTVSIAVLPPAIVAFVVSATDVKTCSFPIDENEDARRAFATDLEAIPTRLREGVGRRAIPAVLQQLAGKLVDVIADRKVAALLPHSTLHLVPWRALLRSCGLQWSQLAARVEFGLLLRSRPAVQAPPSSAVALGHGVAGEVDLCDEASAFAHEFRSQGRAIRDCTSKDVRSALGGDSIVLVSCHGDVTRSGSFESSADLVLHLEDGPIPATQVIPPQVHASLVILSACESGVYWMGHGDLPAGAAPELLHAGARNCIGTRFRIGARFAGTFFPTLGRELASGTPVAKAVAVVSEAHEASFDLWRDLACVELLGA